MSDHRRNDATMSMSDDDLTCDRLVDALTDLTAAAGSLPAPAEIHIPDPRDLEAVTDCLRTGLGAGMVLPDPADQSRRTVRVVARC